MRQSVARAIKREAAILEPGQPVAGADPEAAFGVLRQRSDLVVWQTFAGRVDGKPLTFEKGESAVGADPEAALAVFQQGFGGLIGQAVARRVQAELPVAIAYQSTAIGGQPEVALTVLQQGGDVAAFDGGGVAVVKDSKVRPIETGRAGQRAQPEIPVPRPGNRLNRVLRQTLLFPPDELLIATKYLVRAGRLTERAAG